MTPDVAVDVLQKYIDKQNRPISVANMCDAHAAQGLGAAGAKKALDSLFSRGTVDMKLCAPLLLVRTVSLLPLPPQPVLRLGITVCGSLNPHITDAERVDTARASTI